MNLERPEGTTERPLRLMLFGPPNVGKSSLANRLLGTQKAPFGAKPGLTRGSHWLRGRGFLEVLDTPGVIETALVKGESKLKLAAVCARSWLLTVRKSRPTMTARLLSFWRSSADREGFSGKEASSTSIAPARLSSMRSEKGSWVA